MKSFKQTINEISDTLKNNYISKAVSSGNDYMDKARKARTDRAKNPGDSQEYRSHEKNMLRKANNRDAGVSSAIASLHSKG